MIFGENLKSPESTLPDRRNDSPNRYLSRTSIIVPRTKIYKNSMQCSTTAGALKNTTGITKIGSNIYVKNYIARFFKFNMKMKWKQKLNVIKYY
jgi:hypothetical protein